MSLRFRPCARSVRALIALLPAAMPASALVAQSFKENDVRVVHTFTGERAGDVYGWVTARIADLDDDDVADLLITAPFNDAAGSNAGRVYAYSSRTGSLIRVFTGATVGGQFGNAVADVGLIDEDDVPEILIGAPGQQSVGSGSAYLYSGQSGALIRQFDGENPGDNFGGAVRPAGDMDGDLVPDLLIGAAGYDGGAGANSGRVYVLSGATGRRIKRLDGPSANAQFGSAVAPLGDITGDDVSDFIVGAPNAGIGTRGIAYVYSGADFSVLCELTAENTGANLGQYFMSSPGDITGDQKPDIYVTDWQDFARGSTTGRAYLYSFDGDSCVRLYTLLGTSAGQGFGIGNGTAGDVNRDGKRDLLIGSWISPDGAANAGKVEVFNGPNGARIRTITSTTAQEALGFDAHTMEDVTGDGFPDFLLSAAYHPALGTQTGRVYLVAGNNPHPGDFDLDTDVDLADYDAFSACMTGPGGGPVGNDCWNADLDFDDDVDVQDVATFQRRFTGE